MADDRRGSPDPPAILGGPGQDLWVRVLSDYEMAAAELAVLEAACSAYDRMTLGQQILNTEGMSVKDRYGVAKAHPMTTVVKDASTLLARCLRQLDVDLDEEAPRPKPHGAKRGPRPKPPRPLREVS